jgi:hypothetical protein
MHWLFKNEPDFYRIWSYPAVDERGCVYCFTTAGGCRKNSQSIIMIGVSGICIGLFNSISLFKRRIPTH